MGSDNIRVVYFHDNPKMLCLEEDFNNLGDLQPIALTPERLKKCGFEKENGYWFLKQSIDDWHILYNVHGFFVFHESTDPEDVHILVKYVNHLQNIFYALTCEELEINLPF